jgi:hypothetical protein
MSICNIAEVQFRLNWIEFTWKIVSDLIHIHAWKLQTIHINVQPTKKAENPYTWSEVTIWHPDLSPNIGLIKSTMRFMQCGMTQGRLHISVICTSQLAICVKQHLRQLLSSQWYWLLFLFLQLMVTIYIISVQFLGTHLKCIQMDYIRHNPLPEKTHQTNANLHNPQKDKTSCALRERRTQVWSHSWLRFGHVAGYNHAHDLICALQYSVHSEIPYISFHLQEFLKISVGCT